MGIKVNVGDPAPDIPVKDQNGKPVRISDLKGKNVVVYFYPEDDTSGCTVEACGFRDDLEAFEETDAVILGVSTDGEASHQEFIKKYGLNFTLLADTEGKLSTAYGVLGDGFDAKRSTFIIDKTGRIRKIFPKVSVTGHSREVWEAIRELG